jgi:hypothetical protein
MKTALKIGLLLTVCARMATAAPTNSVAVTSSSVPEPVKCNVGGTSIKFPLPDPQFTEVGYDSRSFMEVMVPTQNRLVCAYVLTNDLIHLTKRDDNLQLSRYIMVQVPRRGEFSDCSADNFAEVMSSAKETFGDKAGSGAESLFKEADEEINRRLKSLDLEGSIKLGKPVQLGTLFSIKDASAFGLIMPVIVEKKTVKMGGGIILMRVKSRLLFVYVYSEYKGEETIRYLGQITEKWAKQILAANVE